MKRFFQVLIVFSFLLSGTGPAASLAYSVPGGQLQDGPGGEPAPEAPGLWPSIFLPIVQWFSVHTVAGQVVDENNKPLPDVLIADSAGHTARTDSQGKYTLSEVPTSAGLAASRSGYIFDPALRLLTEAADLNALNFKGLAATKELVVNGNFESGTKGWVLDASHDKYAPIYYNDKFSNHFMRTGVTVDPGFAGWSEIRQQVKIDAAATSAVLTLDIFPIHSKSPIPANLQVEDGEKADPEGAVETSIEDVEYIQVLDTSGHILDSLVYELIDDDGFWRTLEFDLSGYAGETIQIVTGVYNDGTGQITAMFIDNVSLQVETGGTPPAPIVGCDNGLVNSSFERTGSWVIPVTEYTAGYSTAQAHKGTRSLRTGILSKASNRYSYSVAWQNVTIPADIDHAMLRMWVYPQVDGAVAEEQYPADLAAVSGAVASLPQFGLGTSQPEAPIEGALVEGDVQFVQIYDRTGTTLLKTVYAKLSDKRGWEFVEANLIEYRGQTLRVYFGAYNDGSGAAAAMYADEVVVELCELDAEPTPTPTATASPTPGVCDIDIIVNNGFEKDTGWGIPITQFSAGYTTEKEYQGARSMRSGIPFSQHNRYSYSDFYQVVSIPEDWDKATLSFWYYPKSTVISVHNVTDPFGFDSAARDVQYLLVLDRWGNWIDTLMWTRSNAKAWTAFEISLNGYIGETIRLQWGVYNDGSDGVTAMWVDSAALTPCP